jgi:hypothetical protein
MIGRVVRSNPMIDRRNPNVQRYGTGNRFMSPLQGMQPTLTYGMHPMIQQNTLQNSTNQVISDQQTGRIGHVVMASSPMIDIINNRRRPGLRQPMINRYGNRNIAL